MLMLSVVSKTEPDKLEPTRPTRSRKQRRPTHHRNGVKITHSCNCCRGEQLPQKRVPALEAFPPGRRAADAPDRPTYFAGAQPSGPGAKCAADLEAQAGILRGWSSGHVYTSDCGGRGCGYAMTMRGSDLKTNETSEKTTLYDQDILCFSCS
ncbi:hypothetical protein BV25DRAFT_1640587 [Artomyces pyxidatus]|uniref:Uncharacterized protein n=1 Tax=Artomyces pyxidatus TaxID=48021 RepID=A0ACB8SJF6_9AGAM|nr:hypothetical protein BV25DRAFT_1640587 [Artomyces pyxidatus]